MKHYIVHILDSKMLIVDAQKVQDKKEALDIFENIIKHNIKCQVMEFSKDSGFTEIAKSY